MCFNFLVKPFRIVQNNHLIMHVKKFPKVMFQPFCSTHPSHLVLVLCWSPPQDCFHFVSFSMTVDATLKGPVLGPKPVMQGLDRGWSKSPNKCWDRAAETYPPRAKKKKEHGSAALLRELVVGMIPIFKVKIPS